jgi:hypothetical protein
MRRFGGEGRGTGPAPGDAPSPELLTWGGVALLVELYGLTLDNAAGVVLARLGITGVFTGATLFAWRLCRRWRGGGRR